MSVISILKSSARRFRKSDPLILAGATSFFASFSLSPFIVIFINVFGLYFRNSEIRSILIAKLEGMFGSETSSYVESIVDNVNSTRLNWLAGILGFAFLLFVATTLLKVVREAIHKIWRMQRVHVNRFRYGFKERSTSAFIILLTGLLVGASIMADTSLTLFHEYLNRELPYSHMGLVRGINILSSLLITSAWFAMIFKILPEARVHWRVAGAGGVLTGILFNIGKLILGRLLLYDALANIFGPPASFVLLLLFIFYSSLIFYFGAAFTIELAASLKRPIQAGKYSEEYEFTRRKEDEKPTDSLNA